MKKQITIIVSSCVRYFGGMPIFFTKYLFLRYKELLNFALNSQVLCKRPMNNPIQGRCY